MSRYIDADELMEILRANRYYPFGVSIDEVPTVDAVEVIRCKDCKYYKKKYGVCKGYVPEIRGKSDNDFCSSAERREE